MDFNFNLEEQVLEETLVLTTQEVDSLLNDSVSASPMNQDRRTTTARQ